MAKKRGLAANRGLDALLGSIKKEKAITAHALRDDAVNAEAENTQDSKAVDNLNNGELKNVSRSTKSKASTQTAKKKSTAKSAVKTAIKKKPTRSKTVDKIASEKVLNSQSVGLDENADNEMMLVQMDIDRLQAGKYQPRRDMSEPALAELADSIRQHGVMQPIVIRPLLDSEDKVEEDVTHEIIAGERRWRAAKMAGQETIPAIERVLSDELAIALALIENIQREDLSVIEQAAALQRFHTEFGMSHTMIADVVGKARTTVSNLLRLNHLHEDVKDHLNEGDLDMGHARTLLSLSSEQQPIIAKKIIDASMTVRDAEKLVKSILNPESVKQPEQVQSDAEIQKLNQQLSDYLGATVKLKQKKGGKGSLEIIYHSQEELDAILAHIRD